MIRFEDDRVISFLQDDLSRTYSRFLVLCKSKNHSGVNNGLSVIQIRKEMPFKKCPVNDLSNW